MKPRYAWMAPCRHGRNALGGGRQGHADADRERFLYVGLRSIHAREGARQGGGVADAAAAQRNTQSSGSEHLFASSIDCMEPARFVPLRHRNSFCRRTCQKREPSLASTSSVNMPWTPSRPGARRRLRSSTQYEMNQMYSSGLKLPPVIVISLVDSHDRRAHMTEQMARAGVPFRFFDAKRIREYPPTYDAQTRLRIYGNHLTLGEVGCYDSHYQIWQALVRSDDDIWCVLEDDIELMADFAPRLASALEVTVPWGILRLKSEGSAGSWRVGELPGGGALCDHRKQPGGTQGYLIRRDAALALLEYGKRMIHPVDDMLNRNWEHGVRMISMVPKIVDHRDDQLGTTIDGRRKAKRSIVQKLRREFHMGRDSLNSHLDAWRRRRLGHHA
ncbi:glycosyltransferase family 25 protein [Pandoraea sp. CB10b_02]|uniref:glycosyltransferase family 25 protein n=1 Tax=Pandoraea sp. CB10b_02 TaxID=2014535 RepID=UPI00338F0F4D